MNAIEYINKLTRKQNFGNDLTGMNHFKNQLMNALFLGNVLSDVLPGKTNEAVRHAIASTKDIEPFDEIDPLELLYKLNNWIKFGNVNNTIKSMFYVEKHKLIKYYLERGRVTDIIEQHLKEEDGFLFTIDDKYQFHQPKRYFPELKAEKQGEYWEPENKEYNLTMADVYKFMVLSKLTRNKK